MERSRKGLTFWVLLLVAVIAPSTALATKRVYKAAMTDNGAGRGSSVISVRNGEHEYIARSTNLTGANQVNAVWLEGEVTQGSGITWRIPLCTNGGPTPDDCAYFPSGDPRAGNLDISGTITPIQLMQAWRSDGGTFGITGGQFDTALDEERMTVVFADGPAESYVRILATGVFDRIL